MVVTAINSENLQYFENLLLPGVFNVLKNGEPVSALGLVEGNVACGAAAGYIENSTFQIASLFVAPDYRRKGGATLLLDTLKRTLLEFDGIYYMRTDFTISREDHLTLKPFFEKSGFVEEEDELAIYGMTLGQVANVPFFKNSREHTSQRVTPFSNIPPIYIKMLDRSISSTGLRPFETPLDKADIDMDLSMGLVKDNEIRDFILFDHSFDGRLTLVYAYSDHSGSEGLTVLISLLRSAFGAAVKKYPPDTRIIVNAATSISAALINRIVGPEAGLQRLSYTGILRLFETEDRNGSLRTEQA